METEVWAKNMDAANLPPFEVCLLNNNMAVRRALENVHDALKPLSLCAEDSENIELVLAEVLNNVVEHAYPPSIKDGDIAIRCVHKDDGLHWKIIDEGVALQKTIQALGDPVDLDVAFDDLPEGGFGWFLIKTLAHDVSYTRQNGQNQLSLRIVVGETA